MQFKLTFLLLFITIGVFGQDGHEHCHTDEVHQLRYASDADYRHDYDVRMQEWEETVSGLVAGERLVCNEPIIIPVAVHYEDVTNESLTCLIDLAIDQIETLNRDFSATNDDIVLYNTAASSSELMMEALAAEGTCIKFCLADTDHPAGFGLNEGEFAVTFNQGYHTGTYGDAFTSSVWSGYLNIIVTPNIGQQSVLGYTYLYLPADGSAVVVRGCNFGRPGIGCGGGFGNGGTCGSNTDYALGRTAVHEVGHFLGLRHPWGNNDSEGVPIGCSSDDGILDTPNTDTQNFGCPTVGDNSTSCGSQDMYMNFMSYADQQCMYMFSEMQAQLVNTRANQLWNTTSVKCAITVAQNDAGVKSIVFPNGQACGTTVTPTIALENQGDLTLTSCEIFYEVVGGGSNTYSWTGSLASEDFELVNLPAIANPDNNYTIRFETSNPNGQADDYLGNNKKERIISILQGTTIPFTEDVEDFLNPFPAQGIEVFNPDEDDVEWGRRPGASAYANGAYSFFLDNKNANTGINNEDWLILPEMSVAGFNSVDLSYDLAYTYYNNASISRYDSLQIMYSLSCSNVWEEAWIDGGASLATAAATNILYLPNPTTDWVNKVLGINTGGADFIRIAFVNKSGWGNSLFLDNINIQGSNAIVSTTEIETLNTFKLSPNPSKGLLNMDIQFDELTEFNIRIHDTVGRNVFNATENDIQFNQQLNISDLTNGIYFVSIIAGNEIVTKKVLLAK